MPCVIGRGGTSRRKREGDGATPVGRFRVLGCRFRADRIPRPRVGVEARPTRPDDGWCDAPSSRCYNRPVRLPFGPSHERMHRPDHLYDVVLDLSYNRGPIRSGHGSAIFLHIARPDRSPTEGCIAVPPGTARRLLPRIGPRTIIEVVR